MTLEIRRERPGDRERSLEVEREAFGSDEEAAIVEAVRDGEGSFALVAEDRHGVLVGHVQLSRAWIGELPVLALGPIGVRPERQGQGIGSDLMRAALDRARELGEPAVILLGEPAWYPRFGFGSAAAFGLRNPFTGVQPNGFVVDEEDFMIAVLAEDPPALEGEVRWHSAFGTPVEAPEGDP